jgi:hypothetical protein
LDGQTNPIVWEAGTSTLAEPFCRSRASSADGWNHLGSESLKLLRVFDKRYDGDFYMLNHLFAD